MADVAGEVTKPADASLHDGASNPKRHTMHLTRTHTLCSVVYFGAVKVDAPSSLTEINRNVLRFRQAHLSNLSESILCIPRLSGGFIHLLDAETRAVQMSVPVKHIVYCARSARIPDCIGFTSNYHEPTRVVSIETLIAESDAHKDSKDSPEAVKSRPARSTSQPSDASATETQPSGEHPPTSPPSAPLESAFESERAAQEAAASGSTTDAKSPQTAPNTSPPQAATGADGHTERKDSGDTEKTSAELARQRNEAAWHLHRDSNFYCHVFRFQSAIKAEHALQCIAHAFGRMQIGDDGKVGDPYKYQFEMSVGITEDDGKGTHYFAPTAKEAFKLRLDHARRLHIVLTQCSSQHAIIEKAIGVLSPDGGLAYGMVSSAVQDSKSLYIVCEWDPPKRLLAESVKEPVTVPIAIDIVLLGVSEPVRLARDIKVHVYNARERFWSYGKKENIPRTFEVQLHAKQTSAGQAEFVVANVALLVPTVKDTYMSRLNKMLGKLTEEMRAHTPENESPPDIPVSAGSVERDVGGTVLDQWGEALRLWDSQSHSRILTLVKRGIPDTLRHQVWLRLAGGVATDLADLYPYLLTRDPTSNEERSDLKVIKWDLTRTFPAHDFFKDPEGEGQRRLFNICRAYAVYDEEIGYCQGLSFISAVLLLHMPEEEAFIMFVKIMFDYGVRDLFKHGFEMLQLKLFQLNKLLEEHLPDVHQYFAQLGVVPHMYASQWFLTLFVAKFSLPMVYHIMDLFLCETDAQAESVIKVAVGIKINAKKLQQYEQEYYLQKAQEADDSEDPQKKIAQLQQTSNELKLHNTRLEQEAETIAQDLLNQRAEMQAVIDRLEQEKAATLQECQELHARIARVQAEAEEDKARLAMEAQQVKEMYRRAMADAEAEQTKLRQALEVARKSHEAEVAAAKQSEERMRHQMLELQARADLSEAGADCVQLQTKVYDTELQLASVKLRLAEMESHCQLLEQQLHASQATDSKKTTGASSFTTAAFTTWFRRKQPGDKPPSAAPGSLSPPGAHDKGAADRGPAAGGASPAAQEKGGEKVTPPRDRAGSSAEKHGAGADTRTGGAGADRGGGGAAGAGAGGVRSRTASNASAKARHEDKELPPE